MRGEYVDERDANWERDDPRFRVLVFRGPGNAVTAWDIVGATVEEAQTSAHALSNGDEHLWSLALVQDDGRGERGLVWLSGMATTRGRRPHVNGSFVGRCRTDTYSPEEGTNRRRSCRMVFG